MKVKFKVLFKNGKTKVYKSGYEENLNKFREDVINTLSLALKEDVSGKLTVGNNIIRFSDISAIQIKKVWF